MPADSVPLDVDFFLDRHTESGCCLRNIRPLNNNFLVHKIRMAELTDGAAGAPILLSDEFTKRSVRNLVAILGFVVKTTAAYRSKHVQKSFVWNRKEEKEEAKWTIRTGSEVDTSIRAGDCIVYNSYNVGQLWLQGLVEPLFWVRGIDIEATFPVSAARYVQLGDFALSRTYHE